MHSPRAPSPGRGQVSEDVVRRLEEHDDQQVQTCHKQPMSPRMVLLCTCTKRTQVVCTVNAG